MLGTSSVDTAEWSKRAGNCELLRRSCGPCWRLRLYIGGGSGKACGGKALTALGKPMKFMPNGLLVGLELRPRQAMEV